MARLIEQAEDAEQEAIKLRAEIENMVTYEAVNAKIQEVLDNKNAEIKRRINLTTKEIKKRSNLAIERIKKAEEALKDSQAEAERWKERAEDSKKRKVEDL